MTGLQAKGRVALAGFITAVIILLPMGLLLLLAGGLSGLLTGGLLVIMIPMASIFCAAGFLVIGLQTLWLWRRAYLRGRQRGLIATLFGASLMFLSICAAGGWQGEHAFICLMTIYGVVGGLVWWRLNNDVPFDR